MKSNIKPIKKNEVLNSRFITKKGKNNIVIHIGLSKSEAEAMDFRDICVYLAAAGLKFRDMEGSLSNANSWLTDKTKKDFIEISYNSKY